MPSPSRHAPHDRLAWAVLGPILAVYALYAARFWHTGDDAWITFRFSRNLARGLGLRYNPGLDPVEGYSNFLWMLLAVPLEWLGVDVPTWMNALSATLGAVLVVRVYQALVGPLALSPGVAGAATALMALSPAFTHWATSGLETMATALLVFLTFEQLVLSRGPRAGWLGGLAALGLALIRTEGIGWVVVIGVLAAGSRWLDAREEDRPLPARLRRPPQAALRPLGQALVVVLPCWITYFALRSWWFGALLSNTTVAKVHLDLPSLQQGARYVLATALATGVPPLMLLGAWPGLRQRLPLALPATVLFCAFPIYAVVVGGDYMPFGRMLLPALPLGALLAGWLLDAVRRHQGKPTALGLAVLAALVGLLPAHDVSYVPRSVREMLHFRTNTHRVRTEFQQWAFIDRTARDWAELGKLMGAHSEPGDTWATGAIGAKGYYSDLILYDVGGLVSREVASRKTRRVNRSPGHTQTVSITFFLDQEPTYLAGKVVNLLQVAPAVRGWNFRRNKDVRRHYVPEAIPLEDGRYLVRARRLGPKEAASPELWDSPDRLTRAPGKQARKRGEAAPPPTDGVWHRIGRKAPSGVVTRTPDAEEGLSLYVSGHAAEAVLIDAAGAVHHRWSLPLTEAFPSARGDAPWSHATLLPDGTVLGIYEGHGVVRVDRDGGVRWTWAGSATRDLAVDDDGRIWVLTHNGRQLTQLSPTGEELGRIVLDDALKRGPHASLAPKVRVDSFSLLREAPAELPALAPGHLLLASHEPDALLALDPDAETVTWALTGPFQDPREPSVVGDHVLLVETGTLGPERARALELDARTGEIVWSYGERPGQQLQTRAGGVAQRLPGGQTLITVSAGGRALQVTPGGQVVWDFRSPHRGGRSDRYVARLFHVQRLPSPPALADREAP